MAHDSVKPIRLNKHESIDTIGHLADRVLRAFQTSEFAYPEGRIIGIEEQLRRTFAPGCPDFEARIDLPEEIFTAGWRVDVRRFA
jgi:hypothetical protein